MKPSELRKFTKKELQERLNTKKGELTTKQFDVRLGRDMDTAELKELRREIARIMTILQDKSYVKSADDEVEEKKPEIKKEEKVVKKEIKKEVKKVKAVKKNEKKSEEKKPVKKTKTENKVKSVKTRAKTKKVTKTKKK